MTKKNANLQLAYNVEVVGGSNWQVSKFLVKILQTNWTFAYLVTKFGKLGIYPVYQNFDPQNQNPPYFRKNGPKKMNNFW